MAQATIYLPLPLNQSVQAGDVMYYSTTSSSGGFVVSQSGSSVNEVGIITSISEVDATMVEIKCDVLASGSIPNVGDFILFAKDRSVNEASILGYYGEFKFENDSKKHAELFMSGVEVTSSS